jgi:transposase
MMLSGKKAPQPAKLSTIKNSKAKIIWKQLRQEQYVMVLPKNSIGNALGYSIERWNELMIYAGDGKLNIDNNPVEPSCNFYQDALRRRDTLQ